MTTYAYTGRLTDMGEAPFPGAVPRLWVEAEQDAFTSSGVAAARHITIPVANDGSFSVDLIPSAELIPQTRYTVRCDWFAAGDVLAGWASWEFTALIGGGPISTMPNAPVTRVWFSTSPPPVNRRGIIWVDPATGDVKEWSN